MSDREKLIELLGDDVCPAPCCEECSLECSEDACIRYRKESMADHLISNGVTAQKWIPVSERLPEESEYMIPRTYDVDILARFLVAYEADGVIYEIANYTGHEWITDAMLCPIDNVIAWKLIEPLPEPPKECE